MVACASQVNDLKCLGASSLEARAHINTNVKYGFVSLIDSA